MKLREEDKKYFNIRYCKLNHRSMRFKQNDVIQKVQLKEILSPSNGLKQLIISNRVFRSF